MGNKAGGLYVFGRPNNYDIHEYLESSSETSELSVGLRGFSLVV